MKKLYKYDYLVNLYNTTQRVEVLPNCASITITNTGDTICRVDGMIIYPGTPGTSLGDSRTIGGNEGEILSKRQLVVSFNTGGSNPQIEIIQRILEVPNELNQQKGY